MNFHNFFFFWWIKFFLQINNKLWMDSRSKETKNKNCFTNNLGCPIGWTLLQKETFHCETLATTRRKQILMIDKRFQHFVFDFYFGKIIFTYRDRVIFLSLILIERKKKKKNKGKSSRYSHWPNPCWYSLNLGLAFFFLNFGWPFFK